MKINKKAKVSARIFEATFDWIQKGAKREGISISEFINIELTKSCKAVNQGSHLSLAMNPVTVNTFKMTYAKGGKS